MNWASSVTLRKCNQSFALVITLIMVVLAAIIVIAFLISVSTDRTTSTSYNYRFQAEIAAQNALEAAKKALIASPSATTSVTADDTFLVLRVDGTQGPNSDGNNDAYYFLARAQSGATGKVDCYPLFSGGTVSQLTIDHINYPPIQRPAVPAAAYASNPAKDGAGKPYPVLLSYHQPAFTQWQEIHDPNDTATAAPYTLPYQRYTFWIEDLAGYLDGSVVGNENGGSGKHQRVNGTSPNEIGLFTIFDSSLTSDSGNTLAKNLIDNRVLLLTAPTLKQAAPAPTDATQPNLTVRLAIDAGGERNLIPYGFGFADEGKTKTNLNTVINDTSSSDAKVSALAKVINDNRPQFASLRKGGLPANEDYTKTLAASMLDYASTNSEPTVGTGYRGIGPYPMVVEFYERFIWQHHGGESTNFYQQGSTWWADVKATGYIEIWNMTNKEIKSGTFTFADLNRYYAYVGGTSDAHQFDDKFGTTTITFSASNSLQPNEFKVVQVYDHVYNFDTGLTVRPTGTAATVYLGSESGPKIDPTTCGYFSQWNGKTVERAGSGALDGGRGDGTDKYPGLNYVGLERSYVGLTTPGSKSDPDWRGTLPGLRYDSTSESTYNLGDPRSAYYITKVQAETKYAKSTASSTDTDGSSAWWGRMYQKYLIEDSAKWFAAETLVSNWPDGDHTTTRGLLPKDTTVDPLSLTTGLPSTEQSKAPIFMSKSGSYVSITELGRIYDPIQWKPSKFSPKPTSSAAVATVWRDAWKNDMGADSNYGDGSTLRIGSPEFKQFDKDDSRAARLIDLFCVSDRTVTRGLVNVNSARRDALRALGAGLQIQQDAAIAPSTVFGPTISKQADKFADALIASRPFLTTSQLSGILSNTTDTTSKFFGNASQWTSGAPTEWIDAAREEYLTRMFNLTTARSRNFRVFVTGQSLDKNGSVLSTVNRVFQVYLNPTRDSSGKITGQQTQITYEKDI